ncbi:helix-turn-helix domain-containing protein [Streptacidiphilus albus]|uniref:helix-turn-helix domain-containing protein n=1 Tax=Streptacidiphilus albus TaxID=105425 RepID=UPI00054B4E3A
MNQQSLIPTDVLSRTDMRAALAEHDFATAFGLLKRHGISQNRIAAACQLSPGKVSMIVSGRHQVLSYDVLARIADGLRIPGGYLGLAPRSWESAGPSLQSDPLPGIPTPPDTDAAWSPDHTVHLAVRLTRSDLIMDRRAAALLITAAALSGAALLDPLEGWLQPATRGADARRPGRLGVQDVQQLEETAVAFRHWDHRYGGGLRSKAVLGQLNEVASALEEHQFGPIERRLYRVMAQLAGTAATMAWDGGLQRRAQDYYRLALRAAHAGDDPVFGANVLAGMARQMLYQGRPADALELVRLAQEGTRDLAGPRVRAMLHTREAWALAATGRTAAFRRATQQAQADLAAAREPDEEPYWILYFDDSELSGVTGGRLLELARQDPRAHADEAAEHIRAAIARRPPHAARSHALDHIGLAETRFLAGDLTAACEQTERAVEAAAATQSGRVRTQLAELYPYTVGRSASGRVRQARDSIRTLLAERSEG